MKDYQDAHGHAKIELATETPRTQSKKSVKNMATSRNFFFSVPSVTLWQNDRMPGQVRIRVRHRKYVTPWFDYLFVSKKELQEILNGTGWAIKHYVDSKGPIYIVIIEKE
ncbi:MAG: hypothetical protein OEZ20_05290 [candidate division WOR-3 bacterium]|nr:hypothetical protein [candidate division WOR-3 bacterium]